MLRDVDLLNQFVRSRDEETFREIIHKYGRMVFNSCKNISACLNTAEDITQDVFLELYRRADSIRGSLPAWLHSVAVNKSYSFVRKEILRKKVVSNLNSNQTLSDSPTWDDLSPQINEEIEKLPEEIRVPLILHFLNGKEQSEIASELHINQSTV